MKLLDQSYIRKHPLREVGKNSSDNFQTPDSAVDLLVDNYLSATNFKRVWECASGGGGMVRRLKNYNYEVISTDIKGGIDFIPSLFSGAFMGRDDYDIIVTNPPYSQKNDFISRCHKTGKPFALLLPLTALESAKRQRIWKMGLLMLIPDKRVNFFVNKADW